MRFSQFPKKKLRTTKRHSDSAPILHLISHRKSLRLPLSVLEKGLGARCRQVPDPPGAMGAVSQLSTCRAQPPSPLSVCLTGGSAGLMAEKRFHEGTCGTSCFVFSLRHHRGLTVKASLEHPLLTRGEMEDARHRDEGSGAKLPVEPRSSGISRRNIHGPLCPASPERSAPGTAGVAGCIPVALTADTGDWHYRQGPGYSHLPFVRGPKAGVREGAAGPGEG